MLLQLTDFIDRVITSEERVKFAQIDAYGHLNSARYLELMTNHRVEAVEDQLFCHTLDLIKELGIGFVILESHIKYLEACAVGEVLEVASWMASLEQKTFFLKIVICNKTTRRVKSTGGLTFCSIRVKDGALVELPEGLPSRAVSDPLTTCPLANAYIETLKLKKGMVI